MDGEVPQAQEFAEFLKTYNDPEISGLHTRNTVELLKCSLKACNPHFERPVIMRLKSIMGLSTHEEIDAWHEFCAVQTDPDIKNWYSHKLANPWILPSVNRLLLSISNDDWDITPLHSNYVETTDAGRNAETSIGVGLLTAILQAQERDNKRAEEIAQVERDGVMRHRWNGAGEREKLSAQRKLWKIRKVLVRDNQLTTFDTLKAEHDAGSEENKHSLERQKILEQQIKSIQAEQQLDRHRTDLKMAVNELRADIEAEKAGRREWAIRRGEIDEELERLRKGPLAGARIKDRRPRPLRFKWSLLLAGVRIWFKYVLRVWTGNGRSKANFPRLLNLSYTQIVFCTLRVRCASMCATTASMRAAAASVSRQHSHHSVNDTATTASKADVYSS
ncbi:hypothetical protein FB451DRAFT_1192383 [Mycena latifolia]|nr:hypothetical protein FB451DRAFT_1192383 [Mycena latifolia]